MKTIAIIGTGIAGMGAAYFLKDKFQITFYEKNNYVGGHTNTLTIDEDGSPIYIDSAFMVYNEITYPNLMRLFKELDVKTKPTDMSFSVQHCPSGLEFCGTGINGLFAQRKNICSLSFWKLLRDIDRFNKDALEVLDNEHFLKYTLVQYALEKGYSRDFLNKFLIPMSSAVWSMPQGLMLEFPIVTLVRFFKNHGFLGLDGHYQWRTVVEGSQRYREKLLKYVQADIRTSAGVVKVKRGISKVSVVDCNGHAQDFDKVILACHADEALAVLDAPTALEQRLLSKFSYQNNKVTLHTDSSVMPKTKGAWSSWNYRIEQKNDGEYVASTIYDMNNLQQVSQRKSYFISINDPGQVRQDSILWESQYSHPIYNVPAIEAQKDLSQLNKNETVYFCGAYFKYGFHEDGLTSGLEAARAITGEALWP